MAVSREGVDDVVELAGSAVLGGSPGGVGVDAADVARGSVNVCRVCVTGKPAGSTVTSSTILSPSLTRCATSSEDGLTRCRRRTHASVVVIVWENTEAARSAMQRESARYA